MSPKISLFFLVHLVFLSLCLSNLAFGRSSHKAGQISVDLRDVSKSQEDISFSHPYFVDEGRLHAILSSLYFREKGVLKKRAGKRIFYDRDLNTLAPLIVEALSKATPHKEVFVSVAAEKTLMRDQTSTFSLFVLGKELNIVFSEIKTTKQESPSFKEWKTQQPQEPTSLKGSGFWELIPGKGQRLKEGHKNWLIVDIEDKAFEPVIIVEKEEPTPGSSIIEARLRKLEEAVLFSKGKGEQGGPLPGQSASTGLHTEDADNASNKTPGQRLRELKALLKEELISQKDYERKKNEILQEGPPGNSSVPEMLKELRGLKDEGIITESDYDRWKTRFLEKL